MRWRASGISSSIAAVCSAIVLSSTLRATGACAGDCSVDMEKAITIPAVEAWQRTIVDLGGSEPAPIGDALERRPASWGPCERFAVEEEVALIVEQLRAAVQVHAAPQRT